MAEIESTKLNDAVIKSPEESAVIANDDFSLIYITGKQMLVNMNAGAAKAPTTPVEALHSNAEYVEWGDDNNFAGYIEEEAHKDDIIPAVLNLKANRMAAEGIHYGIVAGFDKENNPIYERFEHDGIEEFWDENNKQLFLEDVLRNLMWWHHGYIDFNLNSNKNFIASIAVQDTMHIRYLPQNKVNGNKDFVFIDANWGSVASDRYRTKVRLLDSYHEVQKQLATLPGTRFIYPVFFNSPGRTYYQKTPWHSIIGSGWTELAAKIPKFKKNYMDKQMHIKYVLHVPHDWWEDNYKGWTAKTTAEKKVIQKQVADEMNETLTGVERAGKTLLLTFKADPYKQNKFTKWEVQEMKGSTGDGAYNEDSQEASTHILFSLAFHPALIGNTPGKGMGAGSGSDQRLADELFYKNHIPYSNKACEVMNVVTRFNKWKGPNGKRIHWFVGRQFSKTLNEVSPGDRP